MEVLNTSKFIIAYTNRDHKIRVQLRSRLVKNQKELALTKELYCPHFWTVEYKRLRTK